LPLIKSKYEPTACEQKMNDKKNKLSNELKKEKTKEDKRVKK
jgi:hypothetical protein